MNSNLESRRIAITLREQGYSFSEIMDKLPVQVVKSTISEWVKHVVLSKKARERLLTKIKKGQLIMADNKKRRTKEKMDLYYKNAQNEIINAPLDNLGKKLLCAGLFWCEGNKGTSSLKFTNSDPKVIKTFLALLRQSFNIDESKLRMCIHLHEYHNPLKQITFWSKITGVPKSRFMKPYLKPHTGKRVRDGYEGCININYYDARLARELLQTARALFDTV